jgi:FtsZ-interacting cell division protein ZipA
MSELQVALLAIGLGVVIAVYAFGWWKQRQYSKKFGAAFRQSHEDALYQGGGVQQEAPIESFILDEDVMINADALDQEAAEPDAAELDAAEPVTVAAAVNEPLLDAHSNFIIALHPVEPSAAVVLDGLWQRKFDFRKPLQVWGLNVRTGLWERVIAESQALYSQFRIALQLVDRGGVVSVAKLGDFRDLVLGIAKPINAGTTVPDILEVHSCALGLDAFCAEVDQMVGVNLLPPGDRQLNGGKIAQAAALQGMKLESDGAFHLSDSMGNSLITLINRDTKPFLHHSLEHFTTAGVTLMLDVPRVEHPAQCFDNLVQMAHAMARELQVNLVDDNRVQLTEAGLARIREQIVRVETQMCENNIVPGSTQARRLFS